MPRRRDNICKYVVKFGVGHAGERLDYPHIFGPLSLRCLDVVTTSDGIHCVLITTERCRSKENVEQVIKAYNESQKAEEDGVLELVRVNDDSDTTILTFSRTVMYFDHDFYKFIQLEKGRNDVRPGSSSYWFWKNDAPREELPPIVKVVPKKKKRAARPVKEKKKMAGSRARRAIPAVEPDEWAEFHGLSASMYSFFGVHNDWTFSSH
jgi:hypothetical protein